MVGKRLVIGLCVALIAAVAVAEVVQMGEESSSHIEAALEFVNCPSDRPFWCWDRTCTERALDCPCSPTFPHRCNGSSICVSDEKECYARAEEWSPSMYIPEQERTEKAAAYDAEHCTSYDLQKSDDDTKRECTFYAENDWLPRFYAHNAYCACHEFSHPQTPLSAKQRKDYKCISEFLLDRMYDESIYEEIARKGLQQLEVYGQRDDISFTGPADSQQRYISYELHVQETFARQVYEDHVDAYEACCCPLQPAKALSHRALVNARLPCDRVRLAYEQYGPCRVYDDIPDADSADTTDAVGNDAEKTDL